MDVETDDGKQDEAVENLIDNLKFLRISQNLELTLNFKNFDEDYEVHARKENSMIKAIKNRQAKQRDESIARSKKSTPNPNPKARGTGKAKGKVNQETKLDD
ncbi:hypothetical protein FRX31_022221 [Thalictrum thalictroides]|uniref:Uncharacterized protein n=1 Tax=Thalictrum thalictroides TaxID=46969 RepID=A0A7J6VTG6_THATH|nr:hypothetical protein FRX31_022221 [Thalictrum thalictroides]